MKWLCEILHLISYTYFLYPAFPKINKTRMSHSCERSVFEVLMPIHATEKCDSLNYHGLLVLTRLKKNSVQYFFQNFRIKGGNSFQFMHNSIEVIHDLVFDIENLKNVWITGNNMGFSLKSPNAFNFNNYIPLLGSRIAPLDSPLQIKLSYYQVSSCNGDH